MFCRVLLPIPHKWGSGGRRFKSGRPDECSKARWRSRRRAFFFGLRGQAGAQPGDGRRPSSPSPGAVSDADTALDLALIPPHFDHGLTDPLAMPRSLAAVAGSIPHFGRSITSFLFTGERTDEEIP